MKLGSIPEKKMLCVWGGGGVQDMKFLYIDISHWEGFDIYHIFIDLGFTKLKI